MEEDVFLSGTDMDDTVDVDLNTAVDGGTGAKPDVTDNTEGETPVRDAEGETPITVVSKGETPAEVDVEGETPVDDVPKGATPVTGVEGETPEKVVEWGTHFIAKEPASGGLQNIVDLIDEPEGDEIRADQRLIRRRTRRRSVLDEVDEPTRPGELNFDGPRAGAGEDVPEITEAEEKCLAAERKRKGKQEAQVLPKKPKKNPSAETTEKVMSDAIKVPFSKSLEGPATDSEEEEESEQEEEPNFERAEVWITKKLLESM